MDGKKCAPHSVGIGFWPRLRDRDGGKSGGVWRDRERTLTLRAMDATTGVGEAKDAADIFAQAVRGAPQEMAPDRLVFVVFSQPAFSTAPRAETFFRCQEVRRIDRSSIDRLFSRPRAHMFRRFSDDCQRTRNEWRGSHLRAGSR